MTMTLRPKGLGPLLILPFLLLFVTGTAQAQNEEDVLRYSDLLPGGTARTWALGGAIGAVGADPGSVTTNPAGLGLYNTSEISFTPSFEVNNARSTYYGTPATANDNRFSFNNLSLILHQPYEGGDWRSGTYGISFDRQASYHWEERALGEHVPSTILQQFVNEADGTSPDRLPDAFPFTSDLAWETYGIDPAVGSNAYTSAIPFGSDVRQNHTISTAGRLNTTSIFYAANYLDKLYLGGTIGLTGLRYERTTSHKETALDTAVDINDVNYAENLLTLGSGVDLKIGAVARVSDHLRIGLAFHSPKWLQLTDAYSYTMSTSFSTVDSSGNSRYFSTSPDGSFNYRIRTPWSVLASATYVAGKHGLVSIDYGYTDFRQAALSNQSGSIYGNYDFSAENDAVRTDLRPTHSVRVGTEWRAGAWYFRGGWGIWPNAYADSDARQGTSYMRFTSGLGFRTDHVSIDLSGIYGTQEINYFQYDPSLVAATQEKAMDTHGMLTIAYRP